MNNEEIRLELIKIAIEICAVRELTLSKKNIEDAFDEFHKLMIK